MSLRLSPYEDAKMNSELKKTKRLFEDEIQGPESFVVDQDGENSRPQFHIKSIVLVSMITLILYCCYCR